MITTNQSTIQGRCKRMDYRMGLSKAGKDFVSATFTIVVDENELRVEVFSMKHKKDGSELNSYKGLMTIFNEANAMYKTVKKVGADEAETIENDTIVETIEETTALSFRNWQSFKYCRMVENCYAKDGELVKNMRIEASVPNRVEEEKYEPKNEWEVSGIVNKPLVPMEDEFGEEYLNISMIVPVYQEAWGDREESVVLHELQFKATDQNAIEYLMDNVEQGMPLYLNGMYVRQIFREEVEVQAEDNGRGFGKKIEKKPQYKTTVIERMEVLGGYPLEEDEIEDAKEFKQELWEKAKIEKQQKEEEMLEGGDKPKPTQGFGRPKQNENKNNKKPNMPLW